jgi:hypothetical protein
MKIYPTFGDFSRNYESHPSDSDKAQNISAGMLNPDTVRVYIHKDGGFLEELKDGRFYCHIERDDIVHENLAVVQWYLWDWVCGEYGYERGEKPITNKPTKPITKKPTTLDKLVDVLTTFCDEESLEFMCADDLLHTCWHDLNDDQRKILSLYSELFTVVASREGKS